MYGRVQKLTFGTCICKIQTISHDCFPLFYELEVQPCYDHATYMWAYYECTDTYLCIPYIAKGNTV